MKVLHIITGLSTGGAEVMLYKLLSAIDRAEFEVAVVSLTELGPIGTKIAALNIPVYALGMQRGVPDPRAVLRLARLVRRWQPDIVQTWLYHADLIGGLATKLARVGPVIWNVRQTNLDPAVNKRSTLAVARICARLSRWLPARIIFCATAAQEAHMDLGYADSKMIVIPNGFDLGAFQPDSSARSSVRHELSLSDTTQIIGLIGRFDPQKDHQNFVQAAALLHQRCPDLHFVLCGDGISWETPQLASWIAAADLRDRCHLLGRRDDMPRIMAALDLAVSSSCGEGFPNVIGEAMACGVPCVVTDVGDSAFLVGDTGRVVPARNSQLLADACYELLTARYNTRAALGAAARQRVETHFSLPAIVRRYEALYKETRSCAA